MPEETVVQHPACGECYFWSRKTDECRRRAPGRGSTSLEGVWPHTHKDDWCGEHEPLDRDQKG